MEWNIRNDYDPGDETIQFGTRAYVESDGCIYEITTVATFQGENEVSDVPVLNLGYLSNGGVCVCVGHTLTVFADGSSSTLLFNTAFDAEIETFACSTDGKFLLVALKNGFIHCLHIPSEGTPVYGKKLPVAPKKGRMFVKILMDDSFPQDILVVCASGVVYCLSNFNFCSLNSALLNGNESEVKELRSVIRYTCLCGSSSIAPINSAVVLKWEDQIVVFAAGNGIATFPTILSSSEVSEGNWLEYKSTTTLLKLQTVNNGGSYVALDAAGKFVCVCPHTLTMIQIRGENYKAFSDFELVGDESEFFIVGVAPSSDQQQSDLCLLSFPGLSEKFSVSVNRHSFLMSKCNVEDIMFLEFVSTDSEAPTISLKAATQTLPKFRLDRLLKRKKFDEAESLARNFGLDMSPVHKAKAQSFLDKMLPWREGFSQSNEDTEMHLKNLLEKLDEISDLDFVSLCCVNAITPDYHVAHSLLEYAQNRLKLFFANNPELESKVSEWSSRVCGSILRMETFNLLKSSWDVKDWLEFSNTDLLKEVQICVRKGCLTDASIIWSRHKSSFKTNLEDDQIVYYLLEDIPTWVTLNKILEWLVHLLPSLLEVQPTSLSNIVAWMLSKIAGLERTEPRKWPKIGLDYAEKMLTLMASQKVASPFMGIEASPMRPLVVLRCALSALYSLRSKFYIYLTLEQFNQSPSDVAMALLDYVDVSLISTFITTYLSGYVLDHRLDLDNVISSYVKCVLKSSDSSWHREEGPWELRVATLIPHITNYRIRLECINGALETAPVPWSKVITSLAEDGLKLKHPLTSLIREKQKQIGTNLILKKYGLNTHINKIDRKMLLKFIVKKNHPDMLHDLEELCQKSVYDYDTVIIQLYFLENISKAVEMLRKLPNSMVVEICPRLIRVALHWDLSFACNVETSLEFISAVALRHETAKASNPPGIEHIEDLNNPRDLPLTLEQIENRLRLKRDFGKYLTVPEMTNPKFCQSALKELIQDLLIEVVESETPQQRSMRLYHKVLYAARLLMIPATLSLVELIEQAMESSDFELATHAAQCCSDLEGLSINTSRRLMKLPTLFLTNFQCLDCKERNAELVQSASAAVYNIASKLCLYSEADHVQDAVKAFAWCRVQNYVSGQQEISLIGQKDVLHSWRFTPMYKDPGLVGFMGSSHLNEFLCNAFKFASNIDMPIDFMAELSSSIIKLQNDQHDAAMVAILGHLSFALQMRSQLLQHHSNSIPIIEASFKKSCEALLTKVAGARQFDKHLSLSLLSYMGQAMALKHLQQMCKSTQVDFHRQKAFSLLGSIVSGIWKISELHSYFKLMSVQSTWGLRLSELGISAKELLQGKLDSDVVLLKLIGSKKVTPSLLEALCIDYQLDFQDVLLQHLCAILLSWDPEPIVTVNPDGTKDVIERNTQQQLLDQCWEMQKFITNKRTLCSTLCSTWAKVNFYHHEVFIVILEILERNGVEEQINKRLITTFLKNYRRVKAPAQEEAEYWLEIFPSSFGLPPMAEFRLPFNRNLNDKPLTVVWKEINLNTYQSWLSIASALEIPKDKICTLAVRQTVTEEFSSYQSSLEWCGTLKNEALFERIAACVADMDDVEQAAVTLYFFMNKIPAGLDQVAVAGLCLQYAESVFNETGETEYKLKIEKKYTHLATLQTLHQYGLGQPCFLQLVQNPAELIQALYQHPTILDVCRGTASHSLDFNAAVEEICKLHSIPLMELHRSMVSEWLQPDIVMDCNTSMEDDYFGSTCLPKRREREQKQNDEHDLCSADDNILRACYVMQHGDVQEWASFLTHTVYSGEASVGMRLRAMQCLCMLTDDEILEELVGTSMSDIRNKLRTLAYLRDLEILGLTYSESGFESCDKKELANLILRSQTRSPRAISLLVHLCVDYNMHNMTLWNSIFQMLVDLAMMKELEQSLSYTSNMYQLWTLPTFSKAWNLLLTFSFSEANFNSEEEHESAMLHALTLFSSCPILKHINVVGALEHCLSNQRPDIAALLLPYVDKRLVSLWLKKILTVRKLSDLVNDLEKIASDKYIDISKVLSMLPSEPTNAS